MLFALGGLHYNHNGSKHDTGDGPDEPAVLRLAVAVGAEGVKQENGYHHQPVGGSNRADDPLAGLGVAGEVTFLQQLVHGIVYGACPYKRIHTAGHQHHEQADGERG